MSAANFGREATHAQRVTGLPGFAEGEMGGASRTRAETSLPLSWRTRKWDAFIRKRNLNFQRLRKAKTAAALRPAAVLFFFWMFARVGKTGIQQIARVYL